MRNWSARELFPGYVRSIAGFDFRRWSAAEKNIPTIDAEVWPRTSVTGATTDQNGLNLFDHAIQAGSTVPANSIQAAFDFPQELISALASTFGIVPVPIDEIKSAGRWGFLGFDIVDVRTQSSAFYSFDWSPPELQDLFAQLSLVMNVSGLVEDETVAIRASAEFDSVVKEHAPFAPCGVWVQHPA